MRTFPSRREFITAVDSASPLTALFTVGGVLLFTGILVYSVDVAGRLGRDGAAQLAD